MKQSFIQELILYRYRYPLAYLLCLFLLVAFLGLQIASVPPGLSQQEINSVTVSTGSRLWPPANVVDLPYHLLQKTSIGLLDLTPLAIKLPSLVLALLSGVMLAVLLNRWQKPNVAIITSLLAVSSSLFLIAGRSGTPGIMLIFTISAILLLATLVVQGVKGEFLWKILFLPAIALALYTPLSLYFLLSAVLASALHPHLRYNLRRYGAAEAFIGGFFALLIAAPLLFSAWQKPAALIELLGFPTQLPGLSAYLASLGEILARLGGILSPSVGIYIQPAFTFAAAALIVVGIIRCFGDHHAARSYLLLLWTAIVLPIMAMRPELLVALFLPAALFMAIGTDVLIREWYALFPLNPYARITGLLPLMALVGSLLTVNYAVYFNSMTYSPRLGSLYSQDLAVLRRALASPPLAGQPVTVITGSGQGTFYENLSGRQRPINVAETFNKLPIRAPGAYLVNVAAPLPAGDLAKLGRPTRLYTNQNSDAALRWRLYMASP